MPHTPGPWIVQPSSNPRNGTAWRDIVSTGQEYSPSYVGEALERDAYLIAAAPELLGALKNCIEWLDRTGESVSEGGKEYDYVTIARKAINKAERKG